MENPDTKKILSMPEGQYRYDIFNKLNYQFISGKKIIDIGCGPGYNSVILRDIYNLKVSSIDVYEHTNIKKYKLFFKLGSITDLPYPSNSFDYIYIQDVLHHIDEINQDRKIHIKSLIEMKRVIKSRNGSIIIVEANRYNPFFYPHMVKIKKHNHFTQKYLNDLVIEVFPNAEFKYFETHYYIDKFPIVWKTYEKIMEKYAPQSILSYNIAIINT